MRAPGAKIVQSAAKNAYVWMNTSLCKTSRPATGPVGINLAALGNDVSKFGKAVAAGQATVNFLDAHRGWKEEKGKIKSYTYNDAIFDTTAAGFGLWTGTTPFGIICFLAHGTLCSVELKDPALWQLNFKNGLIDESQMLAIFGQGLHFAGKKWSAAEMFRLAFERQQANLSFSGYAGHAMRDYVVPAMKNYVALVAVLFAATVSSSVKSRIRSEFKHQILNQCGRIIQSTPVLRTTANLANFYRGGGLLTPKHSYNYMLLNEH